METTVRVVPKLSTTLLALLSLIIPIVLTGIVIFTFIKILSATKDIKVIRKDMERVIELLEEKEG